MLKIRMQGTKKDLYWFRRLLERQEDVDVKTGCSLQWRKRTYIWMIFHRSRWM